MANSTTNLDLISTSQNNPDVTANALFDAGSPATLYGRRAAACAALTWGYYGGTLNIGGTPTAIANGTLALDPSDTSYIEADPDTGAVSANVTAFTLGQIPLYEVVTGASAVTSYTDKRTPGLAAAGGGFGALPATIGIAVGDESTELTTGTAKVTFRMPHAMTLTAVRASLTTASSSGDVQIDINDGGTTIFSTELTIDASAKTSTTATTPAVISDAALADDAEITIDIVSAGADATGLKVWLIGSRT